MNINHNFQNVADSYLFSTIAKKVAEYQQENPKADIIRLGIGDVTMPLVPAVIEALHGAVDEMGKKGNLSRLRSGAGLRLFEGGSEGLLRSEGDRAGRG